MKIVRLHPQKSKEFSSKPLDQARIPVHRSERVAGSDVDVRPGGVQAAVAEASHPAEDRLISPTGEDASKIFVD